MSQNSYHKIAKLLGKGMGIYICCNNSNKIYGLHRVICISLYVTLSFKMSGTDLAKFAVQISKDEAPTPQLTVGLLFIFGHLSHVHLATLKIHSISQTLPNFKQRTSTEVINNSGNEATSLARIPFLFA